MEVAQHVSGGAAIIRASCRWGHNLVASQGDIDKLRCAMRGDVCNMPEHLYICDTADWPRRAVVNPFHFRTRQCAGYFLQ